MRNKPVYTYNHLFFTEYSKQNLENITFWQKISELEEKYPSDRLTIKLILRKDKYLKRYFEDILFESECTQFLKQANDIYQDHYHISFLELYEDSPGINAELDDSLWR